MVTNCARVRDGHRHDDARMATPRSNGSTAPRGPWRLRVLGPVEIDFAGRRLDVQGVARALLALLTRSAGQVVSVESLVDGLWGSTPPAGAERAVASYVSRLRKALAPAGIDAPPVVLTRAPGYLLAVDPADVDLTDFESRLAEGRRAAAVGQPALAARAAAAGARIVARRGVRRRRRGGLRPGRGAPAGRAAAGGDRVAGGGGAGRGRARSHHRRSRASCSCWWPNIRIGNGCGRTSSPACTARVSRPTPWPTYQRARARLVEDLGVEPGAELRAAELAVLGGDPILSGRPAPVTQVPAELPGPVPGCVGRDEELASLEAALDEAATAVRSGPGAGRRARVRQDPACGRARAPGGSTGRADPVRRRGRRVGGARRRPGSPDIGDSR